MPKRIKRRQPAQRKSHAARKKKSNLKRRLSRRPLKQTSSRRVGMGALYRVNQSFELFKELRALILKSVSGSFPELEKKLKRLGRIKLAVVTGALLNINDARVDLLLVGDNIQLRRLTGIIKELEAEIGKEIRYVILSILEFKYRYEMYDRFLRDILDSPHEKLIKRLRL